MTKRNWRSVTQGKPCPSCRKQDWCAWIGEGWLICECCSDEVPRLVRVKAKDGGAIYRPPGERGFRPRRPAADHAAAPLEAHLDAFGTSLTAKGVTARHRKSTVAYVRVIASACNWTCIADLRRDGMENWLGLQAAKGASARKRNANLTACVGFASWCVAPGRLLVNPFSGIPKADENADRRRQRRALTEDELRLLLTVARLRPLAEYGRASCKIAADDDNPNAPAHR